AKLDVAQLPQLNPGLDCGKLQVGQRMCVTYGRLPPPPVPDGNQDGTCKEYKIVGGDECWNLNDKCKLTKEAFDFVNPAFSLSSGSRRQPGTFSKTDTHIAHSWSNLGSIALPTLRSSLAFLDRSSHAKLCPPLAGLLADSGSSVCVALDAVSVPDRLKQKLNEAIAGVEPFDRKKEDPRRFAIRV
ncbi:hypothetical protein BCR44DRAFT_58823, partial [Catenaria anguillulae PL171]